MSKSLKNPNGYGSVVYLGAKRRKPYAARVTIKWKENVNKPNTLIQDYEYLGYFETQKEAEKALDYYNDFPFDLQNARELLFSDIYDRWYYKKFTIEEEKALKAEEKGIIKKKKRGTSESNKNNYEIAYRKTESLHNKIFYKLRKEDLQKVIDSIDTYWGQISLILFFNQLYEYALDKELINRSYADKLTADEDLRCEDKLTLPYTDDELNILWNNVNKLENVDLILILCYTGMRPSELLQIELNKINLEERYMRGGIKTKAGINRAIPISDKIYPFIEKRYKESIGLGINSLVLNSFNQPMQYANFNNRIFKEILDKLKLNKKHMLKDSRHWCASQMKRVGLDDFTRKLILGHEQKGVTDKVYTHKQIQELVVAINKL